VTSRIDRREAIFDDESFVAEGIGARSVWTGLKRQICLGDELFVEQTDHAGGEEGREQDAGEGLALVVRC
jgi:hypothetical protein